MLVWASRPPTRRSLALTLVRPCSCCTWIPLADQITDKKCPFTGDVSIRGRILTGKVISTKMNRTLVIRRDYLHYIPKYSTSRLPVMEAVGPLTRLYRPLREASQELGCPRLPRFPCRCWRCCHCWSVQAAVEDCPLQCPPCCQEQGSCQGLWQVLRGVCCSLYFVPYHLAHTPCTEYDMSSMPVYVVGGSNIQAET